MTSSVILDGWSHSVDYVGFPTFLGNLTVSVCKAKRLTKTYHIEGESTDPEIVSNIVYIYTLPLHRNKIIVLQTCNDSLTFL